MAGTLAHGTDIVNSLRLKSIGSPDPHPFQGGVQFGFPESHRPADLVIGDQSGHAPAIEVAFADPEVGAGVFFGE